MGKREQELERIPVEGFPIGEYLTECLEAREWSHADLAERTGLSVAEIGGLIDGSQRLLIDKAERIGRALGTSATLWLNLDRAYRQWKERQTA